jgi:alkylation response protein AidB-like acyl-CoA dehydrogenase
MVMNQPDKSHQVFFDNLEVPAKNLIGLENKGRPRLSVAV